MKSYTHLLLSRDYLQFTSVAIETKNGGLRTVLKTYGSVLAKQLTFRSEIRNRKGRTNKNRVASTRYLVTLIV